MMFAWDVLRHKGGRCSLGAVAVAAFRREQLLAPAPAPLALLLSTLN
jgi:hypothetical protein